MDESGISLSFDLLTDPDLIDISSLLTEDFLQITPPDHEPINFYEPRSRPAPVAASPSLKSESVRSRTHLKQALMRDQLEQERERRPQENQPKPQQKSVKVPVDLHKVELPQHVLQVRTGLQNPTKYHMLEKQKHQVLQFLTTNDRNSVKELLTTNDRKEVRSAPEKVSPAASDAEDVLEGILSYEESSTSNLSLDSRQEILGLSEDGHRDRMRKETHNMIERRRRYNINDRIKELGDLLPNRNERHYDVVRDARSNKGNILKSSVDYIKVLKNDVSKMKKIEDDNKTLLAENRKLLLRIQELELKAQSKGIQLTDPTWRVVRPEMLISRISRKPDSAMIAYDEKMDEDVHRPDPMFSSVSNDMDIN